MLDIIRDIPCTLGEGPLWNERISSFFWTDIVNGNIYSYSPVTHKTHIILETSFQTGAFVFDEYFNLILFTEDGVFLSKYIDGSYSQKLQFLWAVPLRSDERFNDAICDAQGRIYAGTKTESNMEGKLYRFTTNTKPEIVFDHLFITNGMGFSPDQTKFYHTDSGRSTITQYDYHVPTGTISHAVPIFVAADPSCVPDGLTVDCSGDLWVAYWGGSCVLHLDPHGTIIKKFQLPSTQISSVTFGGDLNDLLFVTSATIPDVEMDIIQSEKILRTKGECYMIRPGITGCREHLAKLD